MGRIFIPTRQHSDLKTQKTNFTKPYQSLFCLRCFNKQSQVLNIENLWKCANSSYGIPVQCFKTLSHLRTVCKEHCYTEKDPSTQHLNLLKLTKFFKISEEQKRYWVERTNGVASYRDIQVKDISVTAHESQRLAQYRNAVSESTFMNSLTQTLDITYTPAIENEQDEHKVKSRDVLIPTRTNQWSRVRIRIHMQQQRARRRNEAWRETALSSRINEELLLSEMTRIHAQSRESRRQEIHEFLEVDDQEDQEDYQNDNLW